MPMAAATKGIEFDESDAEVFFRSVRMAFSHPDRHLFKSLFRCTTTGRRGFSTTLASVGMYDASVGSTDAPSKHAGGSTLFYTLVTLDS